MRRSEGFLKRGEETSESAGKLKMESDVKCSEGKLSEVMI